MPSAAAAAWLAAAIFAATATATATAPSPNPTPAPLLAPTHWGPTRVGVWRRPPAALPYHELTDVPQLGNGRVGVQLDAWGNTGTPGLAHSSVGPGRAGALDVWVSSNGMWSCQHNNASLANGTCGKAALGGVSIHAPSTPLRFVSFSQAVRNATLESRWSTPGGGTLTTTTTIQPHPLALVVTKLAYRPRGTDPGALTLNVSTWVVGESAWHAAPVPASAGCAATTTTTTTTTTTGRRGDAASWARFPVNCSGGTVPAGAKLAAVASRRGHSARQGKRQGSPRPRWAALATVAVGADAHAMRRHAPEGGPGSGYYATGPAWGATMLVRVPAEGSAAALESPGGVALVSAEVEVASSEPADDPGALAASALGPALTPGGLAALGAERLAWWSAYWGRSGISLPSQPAVEALWWGAMAGLAATTSADPAVPAPGLYGPWATADYTYWNGDYTLDYNYQAVRDVTRTARTWNTRTDTPFHSQLFARPRLEVLILVHVHLRLHARTHPNAGRSTTACLLQTAPSFSPDTLTRCCGGRVRRGSWPNWRQQRRASPAPRRRCTFRATSRRGGCSRTT